MILLKPTFDIHISEMNPKKVSVLALTESAKRSCQSFFKSNDGLITLFYEHLDDFLDYCDDHELYYRFDDNVRYRDKRVEAT